MSSLAELPALVGFFSYSREDDEGSGGKLSKLRERIQEELRGQLGRTRGDFRLWQDKVAIAHGELWEDTIQRAISESVFFIPIITPTAVRSSYCKFEFESFLAREKELDRNKLVFPILYIPVPALTDDRWRQDPLLAIIGSRQYEQWQHLRHLDALSPEVSLRIDKFCANITAALRQQWLSPEERQAEAKKERSRRKAEAKRHSDEEDRRKRAEAEARRQAEEERRRRIACETPEHENAAPASTKPVQIYVSYARQDNEPEPGFVDFLMMNLRNELLQLGVQHVWLDRGKLSEAILSTLNEAELFVVILSKNYITSAWRKQELSAMASRIAMLDPDAGQRRIFRVDKHNVPRDQIPEPLRRIHAVRFYSEDDESKSYYRRGKVRRPDEFERAVRGLALAIRRRLDELGTPRQL
jgi:hypothetical protein